MTNTPTDEERLLRSLYQHLSAMGEAELFTSLGLSRAPSWTAYRRHYDRGGEPDLDRAFADATEFPRTRAQIERLRSEFRELIARHRAAKPMRPRRR